MNKELLMFSKIGVACKKYKLLRENLGNNKCYHDLLMQKEELCCEILGKEKYAKLKVALKEENINKYIAELEKMGMKYILCEDKDYPISLKCNEDYPLVIYYVGNKSLLSKTIITIVGTRTPTSYGTIIANKFTKELASAGLVTMSGLAYGVDTIVAKATLEAKGETIAFLAGGLDCIYPEENTMLARQIVKDGGLVMSTYPPYKSALKFSFLERNNYMSSISKGTLIIEAAKKSGTLASANYTIENGRELFVIPGNINSAKSAGSNDLINQFPETFTISVDKILAKLGIKYELKNEDKSLTLDEDEIIILGSIINEEKNIDQIAEETKIDSKFLIRKLTMMEINGLIKKLPGNFYIGIK